MPPLLPADVGCPRGLEVPRSSARRRAASPRPGCWDPPGLGQATPRTTAEPPWDGQGGLASLSEWGKGGESQTLRYMNCEIKPKFSDKESHNNISKDVYQGLKLNTDFFINTNTKRNKVLWNVKYNLQWRERFPPSALHSGSPGAGRRGPSAARWAWHG